MQNIRPAQVPRRRDSLVRPNAASPVVPENASRKCPRGDVCDERPILGNTSQKPITSIVGFCDKE